MSDCDGQCVEDLPRLRAEVERLRARLEEAEEEAHVGKLWKLEASGLKDVNERLREVLRWASRETHARCLTATEPPWHSICSPLCDALCNAIAEKETP